MKTTKITHTCDWPFLSPNLKENSAQMEFQRQEPEGATVKRWREGDNHVQDGHGGQEEDEQEHAQVEIIGSGSFEDSGLRDVATHHGPALEVHGCVESKDIDAWEAGSKERAHPRKENRIRSIQVFIPEQGHTAPVCFTSCLFAKSRKMPLSNTRALFINNVCPSSIYLLPSPPFIMVGIVYILPSEKQYRLLIISTIISNFILQQSKLYMYDIGFPSVSYFQNKLNFSYN